MKNAPVTHQLPAIQPNEAGWHDEHQNPRNEMFASTFQKAAKGLVTKGHGRYCPVKNELLVRDGRQTRRFVCGNHEIRVVTPAREEAVFYCAPDATTRELKRFFTEMIASMKR